MEDSDRQDDEKLFDVIDKEVYKLKSKYHEWCENRSNVSHNSGKLKATGSKTASKSGSGSKSNKRSSRSSREAALREKAKLAALQIEASYIEKKKEAEIQAAKLKVEVEMAKASAKLKVKWLVIIK